MSDSTDWSMAKPTVNGHRRGLSLSCFCITSLHG